LIGFIIAKKKFEWYKIDLYTRRIQKLEKELETEIRFFGENLTVSNNLLENEVTTPTIDRSIEE